MTEKKYLWILKIGVFSSLITLFLVFSKWLFPFVTSKQLVFNILIEILFVFYLVFILKFPAYRPKKSYVSFGLLAYFVALLFSLFVSVDSNLSFWGDLERLLGFFHLLHFLALYLITITVFKSKQEYCWLLNVMLLACLIISVHMISSSAAKYSQSLLGNRAYLAAFVLFAIFLSFLMINNYKNWWVKSIYIVFIPIFIYALVKADISGSHAGLLSGIFIYLLLLSILNKNKKKKIIGTSILLSFIILVSALFCFRSNQIFDGTYLGRALRDFSSENITLNTRLISWKAAGNYLLDHPVNMIFGVGLGNYALVFDRYFDADFYNYDRHATYFDRAHNNLVDVTATSGLFGLLTYLLFIASLFYFLFKSYFQYRKNNDNPRALNLFELSALSGLLVAYFVQNLAVFDSFSTYMYLMFIAAYVHFLELSARSKTEEIKKDGVKIKEGVLFLFLASIFLILIFSFNVRAIKTAKATIQGYISLGKGNIMESHDNFKKAFEYQSVLVRDSRESYITLMTNNFDSMLNKVSLEDLEKIVSLGVYAANSNLNYNVNDSLMLFRAAKVYEMAGRFYAKKGDNELAVNNNSLALKMVDLAIEASPERVPLYSFKSSILLNFGKDQEAIDTLNYAKSINPKMPDAFCQVANLYFLEDDIDNFLLDFEVCVDNRGFDLMNFDSFITRFEEKLLEDKKYEAVIKMYDVVLEKYPNDIDWLSRGGLAYYVAGDFSKARACAGKILELDESYQEDVDVFLEQLDAEEAVKNQEENIVENNN
jgi:O-antigen ligase